MSTLSKLNGQTHACLYIHGPTRNQLQPSKSVGWLCHTSYCCLSDPLSSAPPPSPPQHTQLQAHTHIHKSSTRIHSPRLTSAAGSSWNRSSSPSSSSSSSSATPKGVVATPLLLRRLLMDHQREAGPGAAACTRMCVHVCVCAWMCVWMFVWVSI